VDRLLQHDDRPPGIDDGDHEVSTATSAGSRKVLSTALIVAGLAGAVAVGVANGARKSIQFDLRVIGQSIYEAHEATGRWPARVADLEGTAYLKMPYRRDFLEQGIYVVVWHQDLSADRAANRHRILAYDGTSRFARLGWIWACRGDLSIDRITNRDVSALKAPGR
jgi:hypothetical protein